MLHRLLGDGGLGNKVQENANVKIKTFLRDYYE